MTKHISKMLEGVVGDYAVYKETHDIIMSLPCVQKLQHKVSTLESALNYPDSAAHQCPPHPSVPQTSDYDEVSKLKSSIDKLTEYIRHLESRVRLPSISEESGKVGGGGESEETVRLEVHEAHDTDSVDTASLAASDDETTTAVENEIVSRANEAEAAESESEDAEEDAEAEDAEAEDAEAEDAEVEAAEEETEDAGAEEEAEEAEAEAEEAEDAEAEDAEAAEEEDAEAAEAEAEAEAEEEAEEAEEEAEEAEEEAEEAEAEDEIEVSEVKIKGKTYFTTNPQNGIIYACVNDDVGDEVGVFKNGIALFTSKK
jgi:hypothetical protein